MADEIKTKDIAEFTEIEDIQDTDYTVCQRGKLALATIRDYCADAAEAAVSPIAEDAEESKIAAESAKTAAESAKSEAEGSATAASSSAANAAQSESNAEACKDAAEAAAEHRAQRRARNKVKKREPLFPAVPVFSWVFRAERV